MSVQVRQATLRDLDAVVPLFDAYRQFYRQAGDLERAREYLRERLSRDESIILLARDAHATDVGFTQLYPLFSSVRCVRTFVLNDLFVTPAARRLGAGAALLAAAARYARDKGIASMQLSTALDNTAAQRLYESLGWQREVDYIDYHLRIDA